MKSMTKHSIILFVFFVTCSLFPDTSARPNGANGVNALFTVLAPSATGKPGTGDYTARDFVNDGMKNNLAFLHEICPPLARVADQLCQAVQNIVQRCINFFVNGGGNVPKAGDTTTQATTESGTSTESTAEETTPSTGSGYDNSNPKFGGDNSTSSESSSSSESTSSTETSSENSTDKPADKEGETTTAKQ